MSLLDELRRQVPSLQGMSDGKIAETYAARAGISLDDAARDLEIPRNAPGFMTGMKSGLGSYPYGAGRALEDAGATGIGGGLRRYGENVQFRNPTTVHNFSDFAQSPWQGVKEISGQAIGSTLPGLIPYVGPAARMGAMGSVAAGTAISALPSYGGIRQTQDQQGINDPGSAALGALASGGIEQLGGVQRLMRPGTGRMIAGIPQEAVQQFGRTPLRTGLRTAGRTALEEGAEELAQNPIEQYAGGQDPTESAQLQDTLYSGFAGAVGGLLPFGAMAGARRGFQHAGAQQFTNQTLGNPNAAGSAQMDALHLQGQFTGTDPSQAQADFMRQYIADGMQSNRPVNLLQPHDAAVLDKLGADNGQLFDQTVNPYDVGGQVSALQQGQETDPQTQQIGLFGGGGAQPIEPPQSAGGYAPLPAGQPMQALPHSGQAAPQEADLGAEVSRAAAIHAAVAKGAPVIETDRQWAEQTLQKHLTPKQYQSFTAGLAAHPNAAPKKPGTGAQQARTTTPPGASAPGPSPFVDAYKKAGGLPSPSQKALEQAKTKEDALAVIRDTLENKKPSQKVMHALEELHKQLSGQTMTQYLREKEAKEKGAQNGPSGQNVPAGAQKPEAAKPVQQVQAQGRAEGARARGQNDQERPAQVVVPKEPAEVQQFVLQKIAERDPRKAKVLALTTGWEDGNAYTGEEIAQRMGISRQRVNQLLQEATAIADHVIAEHGIQADQLLERDPYERVEADGRPATPQSSLVEKQADTAAAGIVDPNAEEGDADWNTGFTTGPMSKVNSGNITGEITLGKDGKPIAFTSDHEGQANQRAEDFAKATEEGDVGGEAITVWDSYAHHQAAQGEKMKSWDELAETEQGRQTQKDWQEFYAKSKEAKKPDVAQLRKIRETLKGKYYTNMNDKEMEEFLSGLKRVAVGDNKHLMKAIAKRFSDGYGPMLKERLFGFFTASGKGMTGEALIGKMDDGDSRFEGKYILVVREDVWAGEKASQHPALLERMFHHEFEHVVDNSALPEGDFSRDPVLAPLSGALYQEIWNAGNNEGDRWVQGMFGYPMNVKFRRTLGRDGFMKELYAQIMSAYHTPAIKTSLLSHLPGAYAFAEIYHEKITAQLAARGEGQGNQGGRQDVARAAGAGRGSFTGAEHVSPDGGLGERQPFKAQHAEGFAKAIEEVEAAVQSKDPTRTRQALTKLIPVGRTPVVLRQVVQEDGSKPFKKSEFVLGQGSTLYLKGIDEHQASTHRWRVPVDVLKQLPELLADPVAIFKSSAASSDPNSYKIVLSASVAGKPVVAALRPNQTQKELGGEVAHFTVTVFPLGGGWSQVQDWNERGLLRYYNDKHSSAVKPGMTAQGLTGERGKTPDWSLGVAKAGVKVTSKSDIEGMPSAQYSKGLEESTEVFAARTPGEGVTRREFLGMMGGLVAGALSPNVQAAAPKAGVFNVVSGETADTAMARMAYTSDNALYRDIAGRIRELVAGVPITVIEPGKKYPEGFPGALRSASGVTLSRRTGPADTKIYLRSDLGLTERVVLHESIHAATLQVLDDERGKSPLLRSEAWKRLDRVNDVVKRLGESVAKTDAERFAVRAATEKLDELVTWGLTDANFQNVLKRLQVDGRSAWDAFVDFVSRALGISSSQGSLNALDELIDASKLLIRDAQQAAARPRAEASGETRTLAARDRSLEAASYPAELKKPASMVTEMAKDMAREWTKKGIQKLVFSHDLVDIAVKEGLKSARGFFDLLNNKGAKRTRLEAEIDRIMTDAADVSDRTTANKFLQDSTRSGRWGYAPAWKSDAQVDPVYEARYKALSPEAQKLVDAVFKHGEESYTDTQRLVNKEINDEFDRMVQGAGTADERAQIEKDRASKIRAVGRVLPKMQGPYAPLKRFGDYVAVAKSQAYLDAEQAGDDKQLAELQMDPNHYLVEFHDSIWDAKARARQVAPHFAKAEGFEKQKIYRDVQELPWGAISKVKNAISELPEATQHKAAMSRLLTDLYLSMLSEASARKTELRRRGVHGEETDMLRSFAQQGRASAHFRAALEHNGEIQKHITDMQNDAKRGPAGTTEDKNRVLNEILARYAQGLDYRPSPFVNKVLRMTGWWMLLSTPSYSLQNATQPFMLTLPVLSGRFGNGAAWASLTKAYKDVFRFYKSMGHSLDIDKLPLADDEKAMLTQMRDTGRIDLTIAQDLGKWTEGESVFDRGPLGKVLSTIAAIPQKVEMLNRITSALAAYRLSKGNLEYTGRILDQTHGNYAASNAPRFMQANGAMRLITQFRKYQLIQVSLLGRLLKDSFSGANQEEKAVARAALTWMLAHHMVMAGAMGLPAINLIGFLMTAAFGGDDEPKDFEQMVRKAIGDKQVSDLLLKGAPAAAGLDLSGRIGMGNAFSLLPYTDINLFGGKKKLAETLLGVGGAFVGGVLPKMSDAGQYFGKGDMYKGFETMLPRGLSDAMKAYRVATEGVTQKNNDVVMKPSELDMFDVMSQAVGLPSMALTERGRRVGQVVQTEQYYKDRVSTMKHEYSRAYRGNDVEEMTQVREEWGRVMEKMKEQGLKPTPLSTLLKAPREQTKREHDVIGGIEVKKSNRGFVQRNAEI